MILIHTSTLVLMISAYVYAIYSDFPLCSLMLFVYASTYLYVY